jgi:hypothetical protein
MTEEKKPFDPKGLEQRVGDIFQVVDGITGGLRSRMGLSDTPLRMKFGQFRAQKSSDEHLQAQELQEGQPVQEQPIQGQAQPIQQIGGWLRGIFGRFRQPQQPQPTQEEIEQMLDEPQQTELDEQARLRREKQARKAFRKSISTIR